MAERERLAFELTADERAVAQARHKVVQAAHECVCGRGAQTLGLLVSELVTNAVVHGADGGELEVVASLTNDAIRVEVCDDGDGFVPRPRALQPDEVGGWGLFLVEQLASAWGVTFSGRTHVWFELPCESRAQVA